MNSIVLEHNLRGLIYQRNIFSALSVCLSIAILVMSLFLFSKSERVIISPPVVEKEFWVEGNAVSATYLEQFGVFLGQLLLGKSAQSAPSQRTIILRHTDPSYAGTMRHKLLDEEEMLKKQNASYVFFPTDVRVNQETMEVMLFGERVAYFGGKQMSLQKETYLLSFVYSGSRLLLKGVTAKENVL